MLEVSKAKLATMSKSKEHASKLKMIELEQKLLDEHLLSSDDTLASLSNFDSLSVTNNQSPSRLLHHSKIIKVKEVKQNSRQKSLIGHADVGDSEAVVRKKKNQKRRFIIMHNTMMLSQKNLRCM